MTSRRNTRIIISTGGAGDHIREQWEQDLKAPVVVVGVGAGVEVARRFVESVSYHPRLKAVLLVF